ncbi:hypothetical protein K1T71_010817 [Dendrolimus kikuchii]|uniref:Uncharacterized protein n=3 Tax=Dendrolimus kikuchii TaxID=765133 RepID=A0ACC1CQ52_9NEOP|nr:hypothetical protein K1T71_010817 [Dendrolimus kikuchii]
MINDLPEVVKNSKCLLFADDLKLLLAVKDKSDCELLQKDVNKVADWGEKNNLFFNTTKCSLISFSRNKRPLHYNYFLVNAAIKRVETVRDLGVCLNTQLTFRDHIINICKKAYRNLGFVLRRIEGINSIYVVKTLFNALVRTHLENNAIIWAPHETKYSFMLERIQNKFTRFLYLRLYGVYPFYPLMYPTLFVLGMVGYNNLASRRKFALVSYLFKLLRGKLLNPGVLAEIKLNVPANFVLRRRQPPMFVVPYGRTNLLNKAPMTQALRTLNKICEQIDIFICTVTEFTRTSYYIICYND